MNRYEESWIDSLAKSYQNDIPSINEKEDFNKLEQDLRNQREEVKNFQANMIREEKEKDQKSDDDKTEEEKSNEEKINKEIEQALEEILSNEFLVRGALLKCSFGSHERKFNILKDHGVYIQQKPMAHKLDKLEFENIMSFGVCSSGSKYLKTEKVLLEKETTDEKGNVKIENVKGKACLPYIIKEWLDTKKKVHLVDNGEKDAGDKEKDGDDKTKGYEVLTMNSFLVCRHGGLIEPIDSGQDLIYEQEPVMENINEIDKDKQVLDKILNKEGLGIDFVNDTENYMNTLNNEFIKLKDKEENKQLLYKVMSDVYRAYKDDELKNIDLNTNEFVKIINELVKNSKMDETIHYFRNIMNEFGSIPDNLDDMLELVNRNEWECLPIEKSIYHMHGNNGEYNLKFVSSDGIFEAVYNKDGKLLNRNTDPINMGTYNYASPNEQLGIYHVIYDVIPYEQDMLENYIDKSLEEYFNIPINTQLGNGLGNIGENILPPVSLNDETIEQVKEYRKGLGLE